MKREPFRVTAKLRGPMARPTHGIYLDSLLMARVAVMEQRVPLDWNRDQLDPEIPIAKSECGRIYLATSGAFTIEEREKSFTNKRFPMGEAQSMGASSFKRVLVGGGLSKGFRIPRELVHLHGDTITWFALGDAAETEAILSTVSNLGSRRGVGLGEVQEWRVESEEPWEGFPVLRDGSPLRRLPLDWPGLGEHKLARGVLSPPYWDRWREEACAC
jgi:hypothetical protein